MSQGIGGERGAKTCPVCNVSMAGRDPIGHAQLHFPDGPLPNRPDTLKTRQLQAELLGREAPKE
jgi:hypothetical protein